MAFPRAPLVESIPFTWATHQLATSLTNPQEHAKKFLHHGSENDRYKFFLQAANLASQQEDLAEARAALVEMRERIVVVEADIEERLQPAAEEAREEYDGAKTLQQMQVTGHRRHHHHRLLPTPQPPPHLSHDAPSIRSTRRRRWSR